MAGTRTGAAFRLSTPRATEAVPAGPVDVAVEGRLEVGPAAHRPVLVGRPADRRREFGPAPADHRRVERPPDGGVDEAVDERDR
jgi:hypothetical protein